MTKHFQKRLFLFFIVNTVFILSQINPANAQVASTKKSYIRIGSLQSHVSAYGSERAWNNSYYEGLIWPANYPFQDNAVIKPMKKGELYSFKLEFCNGCKKCAENCPCGFIEMH